MKAEKQTTPSNGTATLVLEIPLANVPDGGNVQRGFHFTLNAALAKKLKLLRVSLHESGATYHDGRMDRHVDRAHDVFGYLIDKAEITA